jgi:hypothetical protein
VFAIERKNNNINSGSPTVGDQIFFKVNSGGVAITSIAPDQTHESLEDLGWTLLNSEQISGQRKSDQQASSISGARELEFSVVPLKAGKLELPVFLLLDSSGKAIGRTEKYPIEIASAINPSDPKPNEPEDVQPPVGLQFPYWIIVLATLIGVLFLVLLTYIAYKWFQERRQRVKEPTRSLSEDEWALEELQTLVEKGHLASGEFKSYYFRLSEILKTYLGRRFDFDAPESTTAELKEYIKRRKSPGILLSESAVSQIEGLFDLLDRVKFTDHVPEAEEPARLLTLSKEVINLTKRVPQILESSGVGKNAL